MDRGGLQFAALILGLGVALPMAAQPGPPHLRFQHLSVAPSLMTRKAPAC